MEPEILAESAPLVNYGNRTLAMFPRTWTDAKGARHDVVALCEVVPSRVEKTPSGMVVKSWRRAYKGVNLQLETLEAWRVFVEDVNAAVSGKRQASLNGVKPVASPAQRTVA